MSAVTGFKGKFARVNLLLEYAILNPNQGRVSGKRTPRWRSPAAWTW